MKILLVDDEPANIRVLEGMLAPEKHELLRAAGGREALDLLRAEEIDLLLLDVMMPGLSGLEVLAEIRRDGRLGPTPVILVTALDDREDRLKGLAAGADDYITKPVDREELLTRVRNQAKLVSLRKRLVEELRSSNRDLDRFAFVAAHDLKAPLVNITGFSALLAKKFSGEPGSEEADYVMRIREAAGRMNELIGSLLAYSRFGLPGSPFGPVDSGAAFDAAAENLHSQIKDCGAAVKRGPLPVINGDKAILTQLFQNLIANAVKFRGRSKPEVEVSAERNGADWIFSVKDNGIGVPPEQLERIFEMFTRLHDCNTYPGTGIGLAACRRITGLLGGRIWVESEPGKGSVFKFSVPA